MKRKTLEEFVKEANIVHNNRYSYQEIKEYRGQLQKVPIICSIHKIFMQKPSNHLSGNGCPSCAIDGKTRTLKQFITLAIRMHGNSYGYPGIEEYTYLPTRTKIDIQCNTCSYVFQQSPSSHLYFRNNCPKCNKNDYGKTEFISRAIEVHGDRYEYSDVVYVKAKVPVSIICKKHGSFQQKPHVHLEGRGCPKCSYSKGETKIENFLRNSSVGFIPQFIIPGARKFRYDFYIPTLNLIIEYDGMQHFKEPGYYRRINRRPEYQKIRDLEKDQLAKEHGFEIFRIPYYEFGRIEEIMSRLTT